MEQASQKPSGGDAARQRWAGFEAGNATQLSGWLAAVFVFGASCATLVLELVAARALAPFVGSSLYTWTTIIGVVLAGISLGNWLGGRVADRRPRPATLALLFLLGAAATFLLLGLVAAVGDGEALRSLPLLGRTLFLTTLFFFLPSFVLGMVAPVAIRLLLPDVRRTGRIVGLVYAVGTLGSLAGNFLTGFVLTAYFAVDAIVAGTGAALLLLAGVAALSSRQSVATPAGSSVDGGANGTATEAPTETPARPGRLDLRAGSARQPPSLTRQVGLACAVVVVASFCSMVVELAASRILAPHVGVSLYSWTGIIGVVLAGITVGNYAGGWLADRWPRQWLLGLCIFLAGLAGLSTLITIQLATVGGLFAGLGLMERIVALTAAVFFLPVLILGTVSPQVIRLAVSDVSSAGRAAGRIYAWSTAGAIAGTFAAGWVLISLLGVYPLMLAVSLVLIGLGILVGGFWRSAPALVVSLVVTAGAVSAVSSRDAVASACTVETNYFCIKVQDTTYLGQPVRTLILDHLIHSYVKLGDPSFLGYPHEQVQAEFARAAAARSVEPHVLVIGGGGYTYPRWVEAYVPTATVEVVEIDPGVTEVVYRELGLSRDTRIVSHNLDGRQFVHELARPGYYSLVVQDAVNDLSVPYHILTREYMTYVRGILADDGVYLLTVIDLHEDGQLMRSAVRTMMRAFPEVRLLAASPQWNYPGASVFVIAGSSQRIDLGEMRRALATQGVPMQTIAQPDDDLRAYVAAGPQIVLTDQYAPVDNLISILFRSRN